MLMVRDKKFFFSIFLSGVVKAASIILLVDCVWFIAREGKLNESHFGKAIINKKELR